MPTLSWLDTSRRWSAATWPSASGPRRSRRLASVRRALANLRDLRVAADDDPDQEFDEREYADARSDAYLVLDMLGVMEEPADGWRHSVQCGG